MAALAATGLSVPASAGADRIVFATNSNTPASGLAAFTASAGGQLSELAGSPQATGNGPHGVTVSPDARHVYVANLTDDSVSGFALGPDGALAPLGATPTGANQPTAVEMAPDGAFLLVTNRDGTDTAPRVSVFEVDPPSGALTAIASSPVDLGIFDPRAVAISPDGRFAYVSGQRGPSGPPAPNQNRALAVAAIGNDGSLTPIAGSPFFGASTNPFGLSIAPDGSRLFQALVSPDRIEVFNLNPTTGAPTAVAGSPFAAGDAPLVLGVTPDGNRLYAGDAGFPDTVEGFNIAPATGALTQVAGTPLAVGDSPQGIALTPDGAFLYSTLSTNPGELLGFGLAANGSLAALTGSPFATGGSFPNFFSVAVTPTQTPEPAVGVTPGGPGAPTSFDAGATEVRGGLATRFDWDFGDGSTLPDGGPNPQHTYTALGNYQSKLTVTNDCDAGAVFVNGVATVGNAVYCNGSPQASVTVQVVIDDTTVDGSVSAKKRQRQRGKNIVVKAKVTAGEDLRAKARAKLRVKGRSPFTLKGKRKDIPAGESKSIRAKLKKTKQANRTRKALNRGEKPKAELTVRLVDEVGNRDKVKLDVKLKR